MFDDGKDARLLSGYCPDARRRTRIDDKAYRIGGMKQNIDQFARGMQRREIGRATKRDCPQGRSSEIRKEIVVRCVAK